MNHLLECTCRLRQWSQCKHTWQISEIRASLLPCQWHGVHLTLFVACSSCLTWHHYNIYTYHHTHIYTYTYIYIQYNRNIYIYFIYAYNYTYDIHHSQWSKIILPAHHKWKKAKISRCHIPWKKHSKSPTFVHRCYTLDHWCNLQWCKCHPPP